MVIHPEILMHILGSDLHCCKLWPSGGSLLTHASQSKMASGAGRKEFRKSVLEQARGSKNVQQLKIDVLHREFQVEMSNALLLRLEFRLWLFL